jgi:hypothetical protein
MGAGLLVGALAGGMIGYAVASENDPGWEQVHAGVGMGIGGAAGLLLGAMVGSAITSDRWERVRLDKPRVSLSPVTADGVAVLVTLRL